MLTKGGMRPGDHLILTKAIGTGVIFAAFMRGKAHAHWIEGATKVMTFTNALASKVFMDMGATAVTDVSGFGLVGEEDHLPIALHLIRELKHSICCHSQHHE